MPRTWRMQVLTPTRGSKDFQTLCRPHRPSETAWLQHVAPGSTSELPPPPPWGGAGATHLGPEEGKEKGEDAGEKVGRTPGRPTRPGRL